MSSSIFYEPQDGILCRKHAINAFFGYSKLSTSDFVNYCREYDEYMESIYPDKYNIKRPSSQDFDPLSADQVTLVSFILKKYDIYLRFIQRNYFYGKTLDISCLKGNFIFVYNDTHIWGIIKKDEKWYKVDSIGGVSEFNIHSLTSIQNIGLYIPVDPRLEYYWHLNKIKSILTDNKVITKDDLITYLIQLHNKKLLLNNLEIPLNICIDLLDFKKENKQNPKYKEISDLIIDFRTFAKELYRNNLLNITFITKYLPDIIIRLINIGIKKSK
jgi:hypothetical protein